MKRSIRRKTKNPDLTDELQGKRKLPTVYPYLIIAGVTVLLIVCGSIIFDFLPDFKDHINIRAVAEQTTVYNDESLSFFGLDTVDDYEGIETTSCTDEEKEAFYSRVKNIVSAYDEEAAPEDMSVFDRYLTVYSSEEFSADESSADETLTDSAEGTSHRHNHESSDGVEIDGRLYVINACPYSTADEKDYTLSIAADESTVYCFILDEAHQEELTSREFYDVLNGLDLDEWKSTAEEMDTGYSEVMQNYSLGLVYYADLAYYYEPYLDDLEENELSDFYKKINNLIYPLDGAVDWCGFEQLTMPYFFGRVIENTLAADSTCLDGSNIVVYSTSSVLGDYHLGYIYDLYTGSITGFGLCR